MTGMTAVTLQHSRSNFLRCPPPVPPYEEIHSAREKKHRANHDGGAPVSPVLMA